MVSKRGRARESRERGFSELRLGAEGTGDI